MHMRSKTRTPKEWEEVIQNWQRSGLSKVAYCREKQMNHANFHVWIKRLRPSLVNEHFRKIHQKWKSIIEDWEKSGLGTYTYCIVNHIEPVNFYKWKKKLKPDEESRSIKALKKWKAHTEEWQKSGLNISAYSKEKGISNGHFYDWVKKACPSLYIKDSEMRIKKWQSIIEDWQKTGLDRYTYCREKGLATQVFCKWEKRINPFYRSYEEELQRKWGLIVEDWKKSGLNRFKYTLEQELTCSFYMWERRLNSSSSRKPSHIEALEKWTDILEDWKKSGWNKFVYCKKKGITNSSFYSWEKKLNPDGASQRLSKIKRETHVPSEIDWRDIFMPIVLSLPPAKKIPSSPSKIEAMLSQGHSLVLEGLFDWKKLTSFLTPLLR